MVVSLRRRIGLRGVELLRVIQSGGVSFVHLVAHRGVAAPCSPASHAVGSVAGTGDPVSCGSLMVRLPLRRSVLDVGDLEVASCLLVPDLFRLGGSTHVRLDDVAIGLILHVDVGML